MDSGEVSPGRTTQRYRFTGQIGKRFQTWPHRSDHISVRIRYQLQKRGAKRHARFAVTPDKLNGLKCANESLNSRAGKLCRLRDFAEAQSLGVFS